MIIAGDWLLTLTGRPVRDGAVQIRSSRIEAIGALGDLRRAAPSEPVERFDGCALMPGLVNAHTRLALTVLSGAVDARDAVGRLQQVNTATLAMSDDDFAASASLGALECLRGGVTSVGDIGYGPEPLASCGDAGMSGVFYWEVRGIDEHALAGELAEMEFPSQEGACTTGRTRCGLSPHSTFLSGPDLIKAEWQVSHRHRTGFAIHVSETRAERDLMIRGDGPLVDTARRFARGYSPPRVGTVAYLHRLGVLDGAVALGCVHLEPGDIALLKRHARGAVLCPTASMRQGEGEPPVADLFAAGVRIALGTGSPAGAAGMDLFAEARAVRDMDPSLTSRRLLTMMTADAAVTLGIDDVCGSLAPGKQADIAVIRTGITEDPETAVLRCGGRDTVEAVLAGGVWRVRDGKAALPIAAVERAAERARGVAARALGQT